MKEKQYQDYEKQVFNVDEILGTDIKINPDFYIHKAIMMAQQALSEKDYTRYTLHIEDIEILAKAAKLLPDTYKNKVDKFKESDRYKGEDKPTQMLRLSDFKKGLLLEQIFDTKTVVGSLSL